MEFHTYRAHRLVFDQDPPPPPDPNRFYDPGHVVVISKSQGFNAVGTDSGTFNINFTGRDGLPNNITGNYADGSIPGGRTGTRTYPGMGALDRQVDGPAVTDAAGNCLVKLIVTPMRWVELEPTKDNGNGLSYDLTRLIASCAQAAQLGCRFAPLFTLRTFPQSAGVNTDNPAPPYLDLLPYNILADNFDYQMSRWDPVVRTRMGLLFDYIGKKLSGFPGFGGICTQETAANLSKTNGTGTGGYINSDQDKTNYDADNYLTGLKGEAVQVGTACPTEYHFGYHNFVPVDHKSAGGNAYAEEYGLYLSTVGSAMGGPDLLPDSGSLNPNVYNDYTKLAVRSHALGNGPSFCSAQPDTFRTMNAGAGDGLPNGDPSPNGGIPRTGVEIFNFSTNHNGAVTSKILHTPDMTKPILGLYLDWLFWDWHQGGSGDFAAAVVPIIKANPDFHWWNP